MLNPKNAVLSLASVLAISTSLHAGPAPVLAPEATEKSIYDKIWAAPVIYKNNENPFIQEFRFVGRLHLDVFDLNSNFGHSQDWIVRRVRFGVRAQLLEKFTLHVEGDFNPQNPDPFFTRLTDAYIAWSPNDAFRLSAGKLSVKFTLDGATSSNSLLTLERNNVANNLWFPTEYISGIGANGKIGQWEYNTGVFSGGEEDWAFGEFNAGWFVLASVGYDFGKQLGVKRALLRADYVYNQPDLNSNATRPFENIGSLVFQLDAGRWGVYAEATGGTGFGTQADMFGTDVMPWFNITEKLQAVVRYTYIGSEGQRGIRFNRYENTITSLRGTDYNEFYAGLNYFIYGQKLKIQTGIKYVSMGGLSTGGSYNGWEWVAGLRLWF